MFIKCSKLSLRFNFKIFRVADSIVPSQPDVICRHQYSGHVKISRNSFDTYRHRVLSYFRTNYKYQKNCVNVQGVVQGTRNDSTRTVPVEQSTNEETLKISCYNLPQNCLENNICKLSSENLGILNHKMYSNTLDAVCCARLDSMTTQEILRLLDAWMHAFPNKITKLSFYKAVLQNIKISTTRKTLSVEEAIQYLFYCSLQKKGVSNIVQHMLDAVQNKNNLQSLTLEELCIIATSAFQSSTKLLSFKILLQLESALQAHMNQLLDDTQLLVAIIKALRHARHYNYKLLDSLAANIQNNKKCSNYNFTVRTHIMIMYADALYGREDIINEILVHNVEDMLAKNNTIRAKDINSFLWAAGYLGVAMENYVLEKVFTPEITYRIRRNEYRKNPSDIVDSALSLWMLGYKADTLLVEATAPSVVSSLEGKMRFQSRLQLLLTCVAIEAPDLLQEKHKILMKSAKLPGLNTREELRKRPSLQKVYTALKYLATNLGLKSVKCKGVITHINIGGVVLELPSGQINIEVLDDRVCLHKSRQPHGVMKLKLRLLDAIGSELLIVNDEDDYMESMESLMVFLEDAVKKGVRR